MRKQASLRDLLNLSKQAEERVDALMSLVTQEVATQYEANVKSLAPSETVVPGYSTEIKSVQVQGKNASGVMVSDIRKAETIGGKNKEFTVIQVKSIKDPPTLVSDLLVKNSPFSIDYFPLKDINSDISIEYRMVRAGEVRGVQERNKKNKDSIDSQLKTLGVMTGKLDPKTEVKEDLVFKILRAEAGLSKNIPPHWRPSLLTTKKKFNSKLKFSNILSNIDFTKYDLLPMEEVSEEQARSVSDFQEKII